MGLTLLAQSSDDVPALSALVQDAAVRRADIHYDRKARRLVLLMARYCWEQQTAMRIRAALRFDFVTRVQQRGMAELARETMLDLLSVTSISDGVQLDFAAGPSLQLQLETLDGVLEDFGDPWPVRRRPAHEDAF
jgi:hypothetical protein